MPPCLVSTRPCSGTVCSAVILFPLRSRGGWPAKWRSECSMGKIRRASQLRGSQMHEYMFDWRELRRWQIPESRLPVGEHRALPRAEPVGLVQVLSPRGNRAGDRAVVVDRHVAGRSASASACRSRPHGESADSSKYFPRYRHALLPLRTTEVDQIVAQSLREIAEVLRFQRAALFEFSRGREELLRDTPMGGRRNRAAADAACDR